MHLQRVKRAPDRLSVTTRLIRANGEGTFSRGYHLITVKGRKVAEHRHVMAQQLGRPLRVGWRIRLRP